MYSVCVTSLRVGCSLRRYSAFKTSKPEAYTIVRMYALQKVYLRCLSGLENIVVLKIVFYIKLSGGSEFEGRLVFWIAIDQKIQF